MRPWSDEDPSTSPIHFNVPFCPTEAGGDPPYDAVQGGSRAVRPDPNLRATPSRSIIEPCTCVRFDSAT